MPTFKKTPEQTDIQDDESSLQLIITKRNAPAGEIYFKGESGIMSARPMKHYLENLQLPIDQAQQYVEFGGGAGGLVPHLASIQRTTGRPTLIDPAPFDRMIMMIDFALRTEEKEGQRLVSDKEIRRALKKIRRRCITILNPERVQLINMTVEDADQKHPELHGTADTAVDYYGALYTSPSREEEERGGSTDSQLNEQTEKVRRLEQKFLKPNGTLVTNTDKKTQA